VLAEAMTGTEHEVGCGAAETSTSTRWLTMTAGTGAKAAWSDTAKISPRVALPLARDTSGLDELVEDRALEPDVLSELHVGDSPLSDEPADEAFPRSQVIPGLGDSQQLIVLFL
jgi:hypothetical protein